MPIGSGGVIRERISVPFDLCLIRTLLIIFCGIQVKNEYGWCRFDFDERRGFTDYLLSCLRTGGGRVSAHLGRAKGLAAVE
ncbi:hypothetical protein Hanom_Chr12g01107891 [Helianthus anomalus]